MIRKLLLASSIAACAVRAQLAVSVHLNGSYTLQLDGVEWLASAPIAYAVRWNGSSRTSANGGLSMDSFATIDGTDILGVFTGWQLSWSNGTFITRFKNYAALSAVLFEQEFPISLSETKQNGSSPELDLSTAFPVFGPPHAELNSALAYVAWHDTMCTSSTGQWTAADAPVAYFADVGGAMVLLNSSLSAIAISAAANFMVGGLAFPNITNTSFAAGLGGSLDGIPAGWKHSTIMVGGQGVNNTMFAWGGALLTLGGKKRTAPDADITLTSLGYWTDRGAFYYYNTGQYENYEAAVLALKEYYRGEGDLPIAYYQLDSYWYYKEAGETPAMTLWEPMPSVFPEGMNPAAIGYSPLMLHSRMFARENNYTSSFTFLTQEGVDMSLPIDEGLFAHIMSKAQAWGMRVYEQDWLVTVYQGLPALTKGNITAARDWLTAMASAALALNITIEYCMALPSMILHSTTSSSVTNARASQDYIAGNDQWRIGITSLFFWSVGLAPSKDNFWSSQYQPGAPYIPEVSEPNWQLHMLVAVLSTGPVGPSDSVGSTNSSLVRSGITGDGTLLKPDRPLVILDRALLNAFSAPGAVIPDVMLTWSAPACTQQQQQQQQLRWHYVLAVNLTQPFTLLFDDFASGAPSTQPDVALFDYFTPRSSSGPLAVLGRAPPALSSFTIAVGQGQPSAPLDALPVRYFIAAPVLPGGWVLIGEAHKITAVSTARMTAILISSGDGGFSATLAGYAGEDAIEVVVMNVNYAWGPMSVTCPSGAGVVSVLNCSSNIFNFNLNGGVGFSEGCTCSGGAPPSDAPGLLPAGAIAGIVAASMVAACAGIIGARRLFCKTTSASLGGGDVYLDAAAQERVPLRV